MIIKTIRIKGVEDSKKQAHLSTWYLNFSTTPDFFSAIYIFSKLIKMLLIVFVLRKKITKEIK